MYLMNLAVKLFVFANTRRKNHGISKIDAIVAKNPLV